jgi:hypothetical protein
MKRLSYEFPRAAVIITGTLFFTQALLEVAPFVDRKTGYEDMVLYCALAFGVAVIYSVGVLAINIRISYKEKE